MLDGVLLQHLRGENLVDMWVLGLPATFYFSSMVHEPLEEVYLLTACCDWVRKEQHDLFLAVPDLLERQLQPEQSFAVAAPWQQWYVAYQAFP